MDTYHCEECELSFEVDGDEYPSYYDEFFDGELLRVHFHRCPHCGSSVYLSW